MDRRSTFKYLSLLGLLPFAGKLKASTVLVNPEVPDRAYWVNVLMRIATPLLESLSKGELTKNMPVESWPGREADRRKVTYLEAFGRLMAGMSPWLELGADQTAEGQVRKRFIELAQRSMKMAVDPKSPDFMNFNDGGQPLVDAAFLAHAILRAPHVLWEQLDRTTKAQVVAAMKSTRTITPGYNNWLLFSAMVEAFLLFAGEQHDAMLAQMSLQHRLPEAMKPAQVRSALSAVIQRMIEAPGVFDAKGWLTIGFFGHQPKIAETYISTGSLYLCSVGLLPLGLPASDPFWADAPQDWTSKMIWSGKDFPADHAIKE